MTRPLPRKRECLETYRGDHRRRVVQRATVQPFFGGLATQFEPPFHIAHRFVESMDRRAAIHASVRKDFAPARRLGFTLYT